MEMIQEGYPIDPAVWLIEEITTLHMDFLECGWK